MQDLFDEAIRMAEKAAQEAGSGSILDHSAATTIAAARINATAQIFKALVQADLAKQLGALIVALAEQETNHARPHHLQEGQQR